MDFLGDSSGIIPVFSTLWFDSGYMSASVYEASGRIFTHLLFWWIPGDDFMFVSVFSAQLGSTADTCGASVYEAFWKNFGVVQAVQKTV